MGQILKKQFSDTGRNGTFTGEVIVNLNHRSEDKEHTNNIIHDEYTKKHYYHFVTGVVDGKVICSQETESDKEVLSLSESYASVVINDLYHMANDEKQKTVIEQLNEKGFK